jgi:hypothetical protein
MQAGVSSETMDRDHASLVAKPRQNVDRVMDLVMPLEKFLHFATKMRDDVEKGK